MERRSFLGTLAASIAAVFVPKEAKAEVKKEFPYKNYLIGIPPPVEKLPKGNSGDVLIDGQWQSSSQCIIEDGYVALYSAGIARVGDVVVTDIFYDKLCVKEKMDEQLTDIGFITKYKLTPLKDNKVCGRPVIKMANGKLRLFKKQISLTPCNYAVVFSTYIEG